MAEPQTGVRGTKYAGGTEGSLVRDVSDRIAILQPDDAPLLALQRGMKQKESADNPKFEWFEDELRPNVVTVEGTPGTGTTISVESGQGARVRVDDILIAPNGESIQVTAIASDALTVVRSKGDVAAYSLADADQLVLAGNAMAEGASTPSFRFTQKVPKFNYIQIFRDVVELTHTQGASKSYGGDDRKHQRMMAGMAHKRGIEQAFLFGDSFEDTTGTQAVRGTKGLINWISTNVTDVGGTVTEAEFEAFMRDVFRYSPTSAAGTKWALLSPILISAINFWTKNALQVGSDVSTFGVRVAKYRSGHGDLNITRHWLLQDFTEFKKYGFVIDPRNLKYRYLNGLDTKLHIDIGLRTDEKWVDEYRTHAGLEFKLEKTHGMLKNCTGFAA